MSTSSTNAATLATLATVGADLAAGRATSAALTAEALRRIADPAGEGARTFTRVLAEQAQRLAHASDGLRAAGLARSPIEGLPGNAHANRRVTIQVQDPNVCLTPAPQEP